MLICEFMSLWMLRVWNAVWRVPLWTKTVWGTCCCAALSWGRRRWFHVAPTNAVRVLKSLILGWMIFPIPRSMLFGVTRSTLMFCPNMFWVSDFLHHWKVWCLVFVFVFFWYLLALWLIPDVVSKCCVFDFVGIVKIGEPLRPSSPWMAFPALISMLSKILPPSEVASIAKFHKDYRVSAFRVWDGG